MKQQCRGFLSLNYSVCRECGKDILVLNKNGKVYVLTTDGEDWHARYCKKRIVEKRKRILSQF